MYCQPREELTTTLCLYAPRPSYKSLGGDLCWLQRENLESIITTDLRPLLSVNRQISQEVRALPHGGRMFWLCSIKCTKELIKRMTIRQKAQVWQLHLFRPYRDWAREELQMRQEGQSLATIEAWRRKTEIESDMVLVKADEVHLHRKRGGPYPNAISNGFRYMDHSERLSNQWVIASK